MARFFVTASNIFGGIAYLSSSDAEHIKALRIRNGETFTVCDGNGTDYSCVLTKMDKEGAEAEVLSTAPSVGEPTVKATVYVAFSKGDKLEHVVQKSVELGAVQIVLFPSRRCVARPEGSSLAKRMVRLSRIAEEAAKQCGRGIVPTVTSVSSFAAAAEMAAAADLALFCYEDETELSLKAAMESRLEAKTVSILAGPEGGFDNKEALLAKETGMLSVTMGSRILRCETAPLVALTSVMFASGNL
ncbi:MAG: 16S rRNA (uracil(1498)-N(3))-methyltransferase [Oscillospiraceae bacterium]|nr:16S rRNA (uracil(1498)-N(3))-methyltransferase [Oscillospiraceae bacterium]